MLRVLWAAGFVVSSVTTLVLEQSYDIKSCVGFKVVNIVVKMGNRFTLRKARRHISSHLRAKQAIGSKKLAKTSPRTSVL